MSIRVAVFEDNVSLRRTLESLIESTPGLYFAGGFGDCRNVIGDLESSRPDVVIMDIGLPGINGIEATVGIKTRFPGIDVLILTVYEDDQRVFQAICSGASGYLLKKMPASQIVSAIRSVRQGGAPMSPGVAKRVLSLLRGSVTPPPNSCALTERERDVLVGLVDGLTYQQIADRTFISLDTVRTHVRHIYEKLHVHSKSEAVARAIREGLV